MQVRLAHTFYHLDHASGGLLVLCLDGAAVQQACARDISLEVLDFLAQRILQLRALRELFFLDLDLLRLALGGCLELLHRLLHMYLSSIYLPLKQYLGRGGVKQSDQTVSGRLRLAICLQCSVYQKVKIGC